MFLLLLACAAHSTRDCPPVDADTTSSGDAGGTDSAVAGEAMSWNFDDTTALPEGFSVADGTWTVEADETACSTPNVLRQTGSGTYPRALVQGSTWGDATLSVRCRPESGAQDQACGLLFRAVDADN
jgi:hypothetical protein